MTTVAQAAAGAAALITANGWVQWMVQSADGATCLGGALNLASTGRAVFPGTEPAWAAPLLAVLHEQYPDIMPALETRISSTHPHPHYAASITAWNDCPDRTREEVTAILEKLAARQSAG